ncbi:MAG: DUF2461 domain-containing protein [Saprospiraceae bacterium]|nr:DUF2461 domain-containing protein [Saprospiraceae bacterium]
MFDISTIQFLSELKENNNKEWFDANRKWYEKSKADYHKFAQTLLDGAKNINPAFEHHQVKDCVFRINRDIRFSPDKSPYKTNFGVVLQPLGKRLQAAAYYCHIDPSECFAGGGIWHPESALLKKIRNEIDYDYQGLVEILNNKEFKTTFGHLDAEEGQKLQRPPKGFDESHPAIEYLKLKSFTISKEMDPKMLTSPDLSKMVLQYFKAASPLIDYLNKAVTA